MNREHDRPAEWNPDTGSSDQWNRLVEIERRLKEARPRSPVLDWAALEQIANADQVEPARRRESEDLDRIRCPQRGRSYRPLLTLAGSWICGAAVGVLVTLLLVQRPSAVVGPADAVVWHDDQVPETTDETSAEIAVEQITANVPEESRPVAAAAASLPAERRTQDHMLIAGITDPFGGRLGSESETPALRAGMLFLKSTSNPREAPLLVQDNRQPRLDFTGSGQLPRGITSEVLPSRPSTRERLLEELLREASGFLVF